MDRQLSAAVLATFRDADSAKHASRLGAFSERHWTRNLRWLDASGLALYLLQRLQSLGIQDAIPHLILTQLKQRHSDNKQRTTSLCDEFVRINTAFRAEGVKYVNLKGLTLVPDYCPDLSLRYQMDCDFLVDEKDAAKYRGILRKLGYAVIAQNRHVMEFKTDVGFTPRMADLYKPRPQRSVELHLSDANRPGLHPDLLKRSRLVMFAGVAYPALSAEDMFLSQAAHIFRHVCSEWTRISWLLEFKRFVTSRRDDATFWQTVRDVAAQDRECMVALGTTIRLAQKGFGEFPTGQLTDWSLGQMPFPAALWVERYANEVLYADFPGSKLYLILESVLHSGDASPLRRRLFPTHLPAPVVASASGGLMERLRAFVARSSYFCFRLRFHVRATSRYLLESWRWKKLRKSGYPKDVVFASPDCASSVAD